MQVGSQVTIDGGSQVWTIVDLSVITKQHPHFERVTIAKLTRMVGEGLHTAFRKLEELTAV